jgi:uncharacterized membrane protein YgcG
VVLRVTSTEGAQLDIPLAVTVESIEPRLTVRPAELRAGVKGGGQVFLTFEVVNEGVSASAPVEIVRPELPWLHVASPNPLPSLAPGATNQVTLQLTPAANVALGPYEGTLVVLGGASDVRVPFGFRVLSEAKGDLRISAVDEYTYYAEGSPKVGGASVTVRDAVSEMVITNGVTDAAGQFQAPQLPEGYYEIQVQAENHRDYRDIHLVTAGFQTNVVALLPRIAVRYVWTVTPTEIQDRTRITIETVFEAFVPMPVITIDPCLIDLSEYSADVTQIELRITNHGLVAAQKAHLSFGTHPDWSFQPLIEDLGDLPARSTLAIPLLIRHTGPKGGVAAGPALGHAKNGGCGIGGSLEWELPCGAGSVGGGAGIAIINAGGSGCGGEGSGFGGSSGRGGGGEEGISGLGGSSGSTGIGSCDPCLLSILKCAIDIVLPEVAKCVKSAYECIHGLGHPSWETAGECAKAAIECAVAAGKHALEPIAKAITAIECIHNISQACGSSAGGGGNGEGGESPGGGKTGLAFLLSAPDVFRKAGETSCVERAELTILRQRADWMAREIAPWRYLFGNDVWFSESDPVSVTNWLQGFVGRIQATSDQGLRVSATEIAQLQAIPLPAAVTPAIAQALVDRWNRSLDYWTAGIFNQAQVPAGQNPDFIAIDRLQEITRTAMDAQAEYTAAGFASSDAAYRQAYADLVNFMSEGDSDGVCAHVRIRIEQELVSTRDAFDAVLEIQNEVPDPLENIAVEVQIRRRNGEDASTLFGVYPPDLTGLNAIDGTGVIGSQATGKVHWLLVPTTDAATSGPEEFLVAGLLRYRQGGLNVTVPLAPAKVTVYPSPSLKVKYYHQRDVFADDPFTVEVEPSVPDSLAVMVENKGHGAARDVHISSAQPQIVDNDKGLLVDFKIIATEVAGRNLEPSLTVNFGQIDPGTNAIGRWLLTSTILGGFLEYSATFEHLNGLDQRRLSLVEGVEIHEMNHIVRAPGIRDDGRPDFLVNDVADLYDRPDTVHLSNGTLEPVSVVTEAAIDGEAAPTHLDVELTAACPTGFVYLRVPDPGGSGFRLTRVVRSDGTEVALGDNAWTTDRTFLGNARRPIPERTFFTCSIGAAPANIRSPTPPCLPETRLHPPARWLLCPPKAPRSYRSIGAVRTTREAAASCSLMSTCRSMANPLRAGWRRRSTEAGCTREPSGSLMRSTVWPPTRRATRKSRPRHRTPKPR